MKSFLNSAIFMLIFILMAGGCTKFKSETSKTPLLLEERGIWLNRSEMFGPKEDLIKLLDQLEDANFTSIYINTFFRGTVIYPDSEYLPQFEGVSEPDILEWLIPAIHERGMRAEAWMEYGFYAFHTPDADATENRGAFLNEHPELTAVAADGMRYLHNEQWGDFFSLCPANPKSHELLGSVYVEALSRYPFDGINLDRIRFPNENFCYCDYCKKHFEKDTGMVLKPYPEGSEGRMKFNLWRSNQTSRFMSKWAPKFKATRPDLTVSLASLPPDMKVSHAQPWDEWMGNGILDAAMPMLYGTANFENRVNTILGYPNSTMIFPGVDAHNLPPETVMEQLRTIRLNGGRGCAIWYSGQVQDDLPLLKTGPFAIKAESPLELVE